MTVYWVGHEAPNEILLEEGFQDVHPVIYDRIDSDMVRETMKKTRCSTGPSVLDAEGWRRILVWRNFNKSGEHLRKTIADLTKRLYQYKIGKQLDAFLAYKLIPLDKQSGVRLGIGEVLWRIIEKIVTKLLKIGVLNATGSLQRYRGQGAGSEAAVRAVYKMFNKDETERVLMVDALNAFNSILKIVTWVIIQKSCVHLYQHIFTTPTNHQQIFLFKVAGQ